MSGQLCHRGVRKDNHSQIQGIGKERGGEGIDRRIPAEI